MGSLSDYTCINFKAHFKNQTDKRQNGMFGYKMSFHCQDCKCVFVLACEEGEDIVEVAKSKQCESCEGRNIKMWDGKCVYCNSELESKVDIYTFYD